VDSFGCVFDYLFFFSKFFFLVIMSTLTSHTSPSLVFLSTFSSHLTQECIQVLQTRIERKIVKPGLEYGFTNYIDYLFPSDIHESSLQWGTDESSRFALSLCLETKIKESKYQWVMTLFQRWPKSSFWVMGQNYNAPFWFPICLRDWSEQDWKDWNDLVCGKEIDKEIRSVQQGVSLRKSVNTQNEIEKIEKSDIKPTALVTK
jgi:hypothetical protein